MKIYHRIAIHLRRLAYGISNLSKAGNIHLAVLLSHCKTIDASAYQVVNCMDVWAVVLVVLKGIDTHVAVVIKRGVVAVAFVEVDMSDGQFGIIDAPDIHIIGTDGFHRIGINAVNVYLVAIKIAIHVVVEIADDVHTLFLAS